MIYNWVMFEGTRILKNNCKFWLRIFSRKEESKRQRRSKVGRVEGREEEWGEGKYKCTSWKRKGEKEGGKKGEGKG